MLRFVAQVRSQEDPSLQQTLLGTSEKFDEVYVHSYHRPELLKNCL